MRPSAELEEATPIGTEVNVQMLRPQPVALTPDPESLSHSFAERFLEWGARVVGASPPRPSTIGLPEGFLASPVSNPHRVEWRSDVGYGMTDPGLKSLENADAFSVGPGLLCVADGMGEGEGAPYAAVAAVRSVAQLVGDHASLPATELIRGIEARMAVEGAAFLEGAEEREGATVLGLVRTLERGPEHHTVEGLVRGDVRIVWVYPNGTYEVWEADEPIVADAAFWGHYGGATLNPSAWPSFLQQEVLKSAHPEGNKTSNGIFFDPKLNQSMQTLVWRKRMPLGTRCAVLSDGLYKMLLNQEIATHLMQHHEPWNEVGGRLRTLWRERQVEMETSRKQKIAPARARWVDAEGQSIEIPLGRLLFRKEGGIGRSTNIDNGTLLLGEVGGIL